MKHAHIIAVSAGLVFSGISLDARADGPFGVSKAMPISELPHCTTPVPESSLYFCEELPRMHPDLAGYYVIAYPQTGVCGVGASRKYDEKDDASEMHAMFENFKNNLEEIYGEPTSEKSDSDEVFDVKHSYSWKTSEGFSGRNELRRITLIHLLNNVPPPANFTVASVSVNFTFDNTEDCIAVGNAIQDGEPQPSGNVFGD